jgi:hypothetical protein
VVTRFDELLEFRYQIQIIRQREGEMVVKPADTMEIQIYSDEEIARWDEEDRLESIEREALLKNLKSVLDPSVS